VRAKPSPAEVQVAASRSAPSWSQPTATVVPPRTASAAIACLPGPASASDSIRVQAPPPKLQSAASPSVPEPSSPPAIVPADPETTAFML
jgi:hypothetical protein